MAKIFPVLGYVTFVMLQQMVPTEVTKSPDFLYYLFQTGVAGVLFIVWRISHTTATKQMQQFMEQMGVQYKDALERNNKIVDALFSMVREDTKYKALIAETISRFEMKLSNYIAENDKRSSK
jgi:hypothetical protein